jgi:hypothetical protein
MGVWRMFTLVISLSRYFAFSQYSSVCFPYASRTNRSWIDAFLDRSSIMTCDLSFKLLEISNYFVVLKRVCIYPAR